MNAKAKITHQKQNPSTAAYELILVEHSILVTNPETLDRLWYKRKIVCMSSRDFGHFTNVLKNSADITSGINNKNNLVVNFNRPKNIPSLNYPFKAEVQKIVRWVQVGAYPVLIFRIETDRAAASTNKMSMKTLHQRVFAIASEYNIPVLSRSMQFCNQAASKKLHVLRPQLTCMVPDVRSPFSFRSEIRRQFNHASVPVKKYPGQGDQVHDGMGQNFILQKQLSRGGEGVVYEWGDSTVCKIYHENCLNTARQEKLERMLSLKQNIPGVCWPQSMVFNQQKQFVGYMMPKAQGISLQAFLNRAPVVSKKMGEKAFNRLHLVEICIDFLRKVQALHALHILIGDVNLENILIDPSFTQVWLVDTDSMQVDDFPCPVGKDTFTPPRLQGQELKNCLRTVDDELFSIAIVLFYILIPNRHPFSHKGGTSPANNIKSRKFPYSFNNEGDSKQVPEGYWMFMWGNLNQDLQAAFHQTFRQEKPTRIEEWLYALYEYQNVLIANERFRSIYQDRYIKWHEETVSCNQCGQEVSISVDYRKTLEASGRNIYCAPCREQIKYAKMIRNEALKPSVATPVNPPYVPPASIQVPPPSFVHQVAAQTVTASQPVSQPIQGVHAQPMASTATKGTPIAPYQNRFHKALKVLWSYLLVCAALGVVGTLFHIFPG